MTPDVQVVRGRPDDDELAALVAGLAAGSAAVDAPHVTERDVEQGAAVERAERLRWRYAGTPLADGARASGDAWRWSLRT